MNVDQYLETCLKGELLSEEIIKSLCEKLKAELANTPNIVSLSSPITVVGDLHGQFYDLLEIFRIAGSTPDTNYLFLGNYVDFGFWSIETVCLLICLRLKYPNRVTLLRGAHECRTVSHSYGLYGECFKKYGNANVWRLLTDLFDYFCLGATIDDRMFAIHGGLSSQVLTLGQIRVMDRFRELPDKGPLTDLMWSNPEATKEGFHPNNGGPGCIFGKDVIHKFLKQNGLIHILRGHQLCLDGYQSVFGMLTTVWSAPNFMYKCENVASVLEINDATQLDMFANTFIESPESVSRKPQTKSLKDMPDYYL